MRTDLAMGKGKLAAQVAHASLGAAEEAMKKKSEWFEEWKGQGEAKIVVKVGGEDELHGLLRLSKTLHLPAALIEDAGRTQLEPGTSTCLGIGPAPVELVDRVTGKLKLL